MAVHVTKQQFRRADAESGTQPKKGDVGYSGFTPYTKIAARHRRSWLPHLIFQLQQHLHHWLQVCSFVWEKLYHYLVASASMLCCANPAFGNEQEPGAIAHRTEAIDQSSLLTCCTTKTLSAEGFKADCIRRRERGVIMDSR